MGHYVKAGVDANLEFISESPNDMGVMRDPSQEIRGRWTLTLHAIRKRFGLFKSSVQAFAVLQLYLVVNI
jgi:hypothetical protein